MDYKKDNIDNNIKKKENINKKNSRSFIPKITPKSSEVKIKYSIKERGKNKNTIEKKPKEEDPLHKLQTTYTNQQNNNNINNNQPNQEIEKFTNILKQRYAELIENVKKGEEIIGTVEENYGEYPNVDPFCLVSSSHSKAHISNTKKVLFPKPIENLSVLKILDSNLFLTIYNKAPPQRIYLRKNELEKLIKIQKRSKGIYIRECERTVDRLKVRDSLLEILLLLIGKAYDHAIKKITFKKLQKEFHDPFNNINDELKFEDKLQFKLPNRYYNFSNINQPSAPN